MQHKPIRIIICGLAAFVALTAMGGGIALLTGLDSFPIEWLQGTPFSDYTIPALILAAVVGGSSLAAAIIILTRGESGVLAAMAAGLLLSGYILVEVVILKQLPPGPTLMEQIYFVVGLALFWLATYLWMAEYRHPDVAAHKNKPRQN